MEYLKSENGASQDNQKFLIKEPLSKFYIIDASVCIKWFSSNNEKDLAKSSMLRDYYREGKILLAAPDLLIYEIGNALSYNPGFNNKSVSEATESLYKMEIVFIKPNLEIMREAIKLRFEKSLTIYDAIYAALANLFNLQLITADKKMFSKIKDMGNAILLSSLAL